MSAVLGMRGTGSWSSDERPKNYREAILYLYPHGKAPLMAFMSKLKEESTNDPEFKVFLKGLPTQRAGVGADYNNTDNPVTITLDAAGDGTYFKVGHAVINERTLEVMWVISVADQAITCKRPHTKVAGVAATDFLLIVGSAHEEGADTPTAKAYDPTVGYNYTQIFRNSLSQTGTARETHLRTGDQYKNAKKECLLLHNIEMEKAFLFGKRAEDTSGDFPKRTTGGMLEWITSNIKDCGTSGEIDIDTFENFLEDVFRYGSSQKLWLGGARTINVINKLARVHGDIDLVPVAQTWGMDIQKYVTPFGTLMLKLHPLLSVNATFNSWAFIVDPEQVIYRYLRNRDTKFLQNRGGNGIDGILDEFLTEAGMEMRHEECHAVVKNMSVFVA